MWMSISGSAPGACSGERNEEGQASWAFPDRYQRRGSGARGSAPSRDPASRARAAESTGPRSTPLPGRLTRPRGAGFRANPYRVRSRSLRPGQARPQRLDRRTRGRCPVTAATKAGRCLRLQERRKMAALGCRWRWCRSTAGLRGPVATEGSSRRAQTAARPPPAGGSPAAGAHEAVSALPGRVSGAR